MMGLEEIACLFLAVFLFLLKKSIEDIMHY